MYVRLAAIAISLMFLAGCDYTVSLVQTPVTPINKALVGTWSQKTDDGHVQHLLVLPLGANEYLVSYPAGEKDAMFARACFCSIDNRAFVQLTWFGTAQGVTPDDERVFQYATYSLTGETLAINLLNPDVVKRDAATPEALVQAVAANRNNPNLFRETMIFTRERLPDDPHARLARPPMPAAWQ